MAQLSFRGMHPLLGHLSYFVAVQSLAALLLFGLTSLWQPQECVIAQVIREGIAWFLSLPTARPHFAVRKWTLYRHKSTGTSYPSHSPEGNPGVGLCFILASHRAAQPLGEFFSKPLLRGAERVWIGAGESWSGFNQNHFQQAFCTAIKGVHYILLCVLKFEQSQNK